jgi:hypothetical protein
MSTKTRDSPFLAVRDATGRAEWGPIRMRYGGFFAFAATATLASRVRAKSDVAERTPETRPLRGRESG